MEASAASTGGRSARGAAAARRVLLASGLVLGLSSPSAARAQTTTPSTSSLAPIQSQSGAISLIPSAQGIDRVQDYYTPTRPWWISYADCLANDVFTFTLTVRDTSDPLEIWVGTENCAQNRSRVDRGQCWIVARESQLSQTVEVEVPVRNILARNLNTPDPPTNVSADVCDDSTDPSGEALTWYFMLVDGGQAEEFFAWNGGVGGTGFDVVGPEPPDSIEVGVGENQLTISLDGIRQETDRERFEAFCVPEGTTWASLGLDAGAPPAAGGEVAPMTPGDAGSGAAGVSLDAGTGGSAAPAACFTEVLRAGVRPPLEFSCGTGSETSRTLNTNRLVNNVNYAVAIAGQDALGNAGVASDIQCGRPIPLEDFYEAYSRNGGLGGGGFCSFSPGQRGAGTGAAAAVLLLLAGLGWRRAKGRP